MALRSRSRPKPPKPPAEPAPLPLKKRRPSELLFAALDRAQQSAADAKIRALLHELQVHGEEITAQNEQLKKAQIELEQTRDRYADLYDFAPIGYLSLNRSGAITDVNLAGAALLGHTRMFLDHLPLFAAAHPSHRAPLRAFLNGCWANPNGPPQITEIETEWSLLTETLDLVFNAQ